jgi:hypothetical protein
MRRLHRPTPEQWTCKHRWKTTTSRPGQDDLVRIRYLTCRRCGLKVKTEERLAVPWDERDFMTLVAQAFPKDAVVDGASLQAWGFPGGGLSQLNAHLVPHGWQLELVRDQEREVGLVRRRMSPEPLGDTNDALDKRKKRRRCKNDY